MQYNVEDFKFKKQLVYSLPTVYELYELFIYKLHTRDGLLILFLDAAF